MSNATIRQASLFFKEGGSDKVYHAEVVASGQGFLVNFSFGRRGATLTPGTKTKEPVPEAEAIKIFDKLVKEKTGKGYQPVAGTASSPQVITAASAKTDTGLRSHLPLPASEVEALGMLSDDRYLAQEKMDGHHKMTKREGDVFTTANKKGQEVPTPLELAAELALLPGDVVIDYEHIGDTFHVFDLLSVGGEDLRSLGYEMRYDMLQSVMKMVPGSSPLKLVRTARTKDEKRKLWDEIKEKGGEGLIFKLKSQKFLPGKAEGMLKHKFYATLSAMVTGVTAGKRSVGLSLFDNGGKEVAVGKCTVPANHDVPSPGDIVEVRYLYAYEGGSLYQPTYLGKRDDVDEAECTMDQVKYKAESDD